MKAICQGKETDVKLSVHGYQCDEIVLNAADVRHMLHSYKDRPDYFNAWLHQLHYRFEENRK